MSDFHSASRQPTAGLIAALLSCALVLILALFAPRLPLWSLDSWSYLPGWQVLAVLIAALALTLFAANMAVRRHPVRGRFARLGLWLLISAGLAALFYWLASATYLYGDGYVRTAEIVEKGKWLRFTEPLDTLLRQLIYRVTHSFFGWDGYQAARLISVGCGVAFFWIGVWGSRFVGSELRARSLTIALLWASGLVALFFGYVETYPTSVVACLAFLLYALGVLQGKLRVWPLILLFVTASLLHTSMLCFAPALAFVLAHRGRKRWSLAILITAFVVAALGMLIYLISIIEHHGGYGVDLLEFVLIPLTPNSSYWLFAVDHLTDIINEYLLVTPVGLISILLVIRQFRKSRNSVETRFLLLASALGFGFALLFNTHLGFARDWDLFAFVGLPLTLLAAQLWSQAKRPGLAAWLPVWLGFAIAGTFVLLLAGESGAVARFENITARYEQGRAYNHETLSTYYVDKEQYYRAIECLENASAVSRNARYPHQIGALHLTLNQPLQAVAALKRSLAIDSTYLKNYPLLVDAYVRLQESDSGMAYLKLAVDYLPEGASAENYFQLANWLRQRSKTSEATDYFRECLALCEAAIREQPDDFRHLLLGARCSLGLADTTGARDWLQRLLAKQPPAEVTLEALALSAQIGTSE
ncbi:MAG: hypothetical protein ABIJ61_08860 [bacterium]